MFEYLIASLMAVTVIDAFEIVQIDKQTGQGGGITISAAEFFNDALIEKATVIYPGKRISQTNQFHFLMQPGIFDTG